MAKHVVYAREGSEAILSTVESLRAHHGQAIGDHPALVASGVRDALRYRQSLFQSTQLRLKSLDRRMQNILTLVSLSRHLYIAVQQNAPLTDVTSHSTSLISKIVASSLVTVIL